MQHGVKTYAFLDWRIELFFADDSWQKLESYAAKDNRVKIFKRNRQPKGANACRNIGTENCSGQYLVFIDTDDLLASFCLEQRVNAALQNPEADFIIFPSLLFKKQPDDLKLLWNIDRDEDEINRLLTGANPLPGNRDLLEKESFVRVGMFDEKLLLWQDIELHLRAYLNGLNFKKRFDLLPDLFIRISDISLSRTGFHSLPKLNSRIAVFSETADQMAQQKGLMEQYHKACAICLPIFLLPLQQQLFQQNKELLQLQKTGTF
ncbi:MAG: glycosyltransferase family 2 protein [Chitinophagaceae bacterium]|nr:glycosyltransferase family 2 protein [Chitinophagaceae bacterium]